VDDGLGFDGQLYVAIPDAFAPGVKGKLIITGGGTKEAVTDCAELRVTEHAPVPEHAPSHPPKVDGAVGVAVKLTVLPAG